MTSPRPTSDRDASWNALIDILKDPAGAPTLRMLALQTLLGVTDAELVSRIQQNPRLREYCGLPHDGDVPDAATLVACRNELHRCFLDAAPIGPSPSAIPLLSIVSPVFRAKAFVAEFLWETIESVQQVAPNFEIVLVEDGSDDGTWSVIEAACARDRRVRGVKLTRNFGQHSAITAGLTHARGQFVVVLDSDLQDDPLYIPALLEKALEGHDVVLTRTNARAHHWTKNVLGRIFASVLNGLAGGRLADPHVAGYSLLSRRAVNAFLEIQDVHRHYLVLLRWLGFSAAYVSVTHRPRRHGTTSYDLKKLARHAIDGWLSHSNRLLYLSVAIGFGFLIAAVAGMMLVIVLYFTQGFAPGWPSLVVLILTCTAVVLISLGVLGIYVGKIFDQVRSRPLFIVERSLNDPADAPTRSA